MTASGAGRLALAAALVAGVAAVGLSARGGRSAAVAWGRRALVAAVALVGGAVAALAWALVRGDWSLVYVADYSSRATPWPYRLAGLWAGMAGSLLLWTFVLGLWAVAAVRWARRREGAGVVAGLLAALLAVLVGLLVWAAPPFARLAIPAVDGSGLTPVLRHPAMLYHPLLLYAGQTGLVVPFVFAVAGRVADARRWMVLPLVLLGGAMIAGAHWAYVELGWGGYWAWDPVENAALLPWLAGVAFLHRPSRRLAVATFGLALAGAYLTRSGATGSVHAFAEAATVGRVLLVVLVVVAVAGLLRSGGGRSSPGPLLATGSLLGLVGVIAIGTFLPLVSDGVLVTGRYFSSVAWPFALTLLIGMGLAVKRRPIAGLAAAPAAALLAWWWLDGATPFAAAVAGLGAGAAALTAAELGKRRTGGLVAHLGAAVLLVAIAATATGTERDGVLGPDQSMPIRSYTLRLGGIEPIGSEGPGQAVVAAVGVWRGDRRIATLRPRALVGPSGQRVSVAGLRSTPFEDVSVTLRAIGPDGASATVTAAVTPFAQGVWWGGLLLLAGLALCLDFAPLLAEEPVDGGRGSGRRGSRRALVPAAAGRDGRS